MFTKVNDTSLENVTHEEAVMALKSTGEHVRLTLAKTSRKAGNDSTGDTSHNSSYASRA